ncbi:MAG: ATPase [Candidatus Altiarchaeales archaeon HGW-Altiarchaeales-3]|nr:MAG: ATPase [Candidatus Altiarchaeales archaeon HGW-Altiarchaeales-3]
MAIKKIKIKNFKSFDEEEINLGKFNVLIGANASGKSNLIQIFKFLRDIANHGLENAVQMQGGVEYLRNVNIGSDENFSVSVVFDKEFKIYWKDVKKDKIWMKGYEAIYEFEIKFKKRGMGFEIVNDILIWNGQFVREGKNEKKLGEGKIIFSGVNKKIEVVQNMPEEFQLKKNQGILSLLDEKYIKIKFLDFLEMPSLLPLASLKSEKVFSDIAIYDFDPKLSKESTKITGKAELEENGSNLSIVLNNLIKDKDKKRKLFNLVKDSLPFIDDLDVKKHEDKSLLFKLKETYSKTQYLPASLMSDGTINITALIIALYFEEKSLTIIEEPERNIHPYLISKVVEMMRDASQKKQVIVTTHNPEILKYCGIENILLVSRNKEGFSKISRPGDKDEVKAFLKNEIGIEELYVQNLLEI